MAYNEVARSFTERLAIAAERIADSLQGRPLLDASLPQGGKADGSGQPPASSSTAATAEAPVYAGVVEATHQAIRKALARPGGRAATAEPERRHAHHIPPPSIEPPSAWSRFAEAGQAELLALRQKNEQLTSAIRWALGYYEGEPQFTPPYNPLNKLPYWWRAELRRRAGMDAAEPEETA